MSQRTESRRLQVATRLAGVYGTRTLPDTSTTPWSNLEKIARSTLVARDGRARLLLSGSWSAEQPGEHTIDIRFHAPVRLRRLRIVFEETAITRTQELTVWATGHRGERHKELVRRTFTFSPCGATSVVEDYACEIEEVSGIHIRVVPDIDGRPSQAHIRTLQLAAD